MTRKTITCIVVLSLIFILASFVSADTTLPSSPHNFYGALTIAGAAAPAGSIISASIGGTGKGSITTTESGKYGDWQATSPKLAVTCCVSGESCYSATQTITFSATISGYSNINTVTATCNAGQVDNLTLAFTGTLSGGGTTGTTSAGTSGGGGAGAGAVGAAAGADTLVTVTDTSIINSLKGSLPAGWTNIGVDQVGNVVSSTTTITSATIDAAIAAVTDDTAKKVLQDIKAAMESGKETAIAVTRSLTVYKITNTDTKEILYRSVIKISFTAPSNLNNVKIVEVIPKTVAKTVDDIIFGIAPIILQADPAVEWTVDSVKSGQTVEFSYTIKKKLTKIESTTVAAGEVSLAAAEKPAEKPEEKKPTLLEKLQQPSITGIIIAIVIVLAGIGVYIYYKKKKQ